MQNRWTARAVRVLIPLMVAALVLVCFFTISTNSELHSLIEQNNTKAIAQRDDIQRQLSIAANQVAEANAVAATNAQAAQAAQQQIAQLLIQVKALTDQLTKLGVKPVVVGSPTVIIRPQIIVPAPATTIPTIPPKTPAIQSKRNCSNTIEALVGRLIGSCK